MNKKTQKYISTLSGAEIRLVDSYVKQKYEINHLEGTNVLMISNGGKEVLCVGKYNSLIPFGVGMVLTDEELVREVLLESGLRVAGGISNKAGKMGKGTVLGVYLSEDGGFNVLERRIDRDGGLSSLVRPNKVESARVSNNDELTYEGVLYKNISKDVHISLKEIAKKALHSFSGIKYIAFEVRVIDYKEKFQSGNYEILKVHSSAGAHCFYRSDNGEEISDKIASMIFDK